ncbi:MAG: glycosyltransferase [Nitriliruptoraceae bacterium]
MHTSPLDQPGQGDGGGLNVYVREVAQRLGQRGVHVDVFTRRTAADQLSTVELSNNVAVHHVDVGPPRPIDKTDLANLLCAFVLAMERHPTAGTHDILHSHYWLSGWVARRLAHRWAIPYVHTYHTLGVLKNATLAPGDRPEPPLRLIAEERIAADANRVLVLTCGEARLLYRSYKLSGEQLTVVRPGVDLDTFRPQASEAGLSPGGPSLLFVGRLQALKGPDVAVRALAHVHRSMPAATLTIVGGQSGSDPSMGPDGLLALARELGVGHAVTVEPPLPQQLLADRYRNADVVLVPSRSETFGLVALEAQACGTPVVAARVPGLESVVASGGMLVEGHDPTDYAAAVVGLLQDATLRRRISQSGLEHARRLSWNGTVDRLISAYGEVLHEFSSDLDVAV